MLQLTKVQKMAFGLTSLHWANPLLSRPLPMMVVLSPCYPSLLTTWYDIGCCTLDLSTSKYGGTFSPTNAQIKYINMYMKHRNASWCKKRSTEKCTLLLGAMMIFRNCSSSAPETTFITTSQQCIVIQVYKAANYMRKNHRWETYLQIHQYRITRFHIPF